MGEMAPRRKRQGEIAPGRMARGRNGLKALRVKFSSPITFSNVKREQYEKRNLGQDLPILLKYLP